nr:hypothetical protein [Tanacetum cinerariifolium]
MVEFLRLPNFKGCKVAAGTLLPLGAARVTHLAPYAAWLEDIPANTGDMIVVEIPCRMVVDDKEKKKRKVEVKAATKAPVAPPDSKHVSSPTLLNLAKPLESLANEDHVSPLLSVGRMDTLRDQTDEHAISPKVVFANRLLTRGKGNADASYVLEGHGDNKGSLSGLQIRPSPVHPSGRRRDILEEPAPENVVPDAKASYSTGRFGNLPLPLNGGSRTQAVWTTHDPTNTCEPLCQHTGTSDQKASCRRLRKFQRRLEELEEEKKEVANLNSSQVGQIRLLKEALKQAEADAKQLRAEKVHFAVEAGKEEIVRKKIMNQYLPTFVRRVHQSAEYKRSLGQVFTLAVEKGFIDGISIGGKEEDTQAILKATPNADPTSSETFLTAYKKLFDQSQRRSLRPLESVLYLKDEGETTCCVSRRQSPSFASRMAG